MEIYNDKYCVYIHTNKTNGKVYVGQTCQVPEERWRKNGTGYRPRKNNTCRFWNAIQKYGWDNFEHEVIASNLTLEEANNFEELLIEKLDSTNPEKGYNLQSGGKNHKQAEETRQKISKNLKGKMAGENNPMYGVSRYGEDNPFYGKKHTDETKEKISQARIGKYTGENSPRYGVHVSEETKKKISEAKKGNMKVKVDQFDLDGNFIRTWNGIKQAADTLGIQQTGISACCRGVKYYNQSGGFIWRYHVEENVA